MAERTEGQEQEKIQDKPSQLVSYANLCTITLTPEEAVLHFGERNATNPNEGAGVAKIYLSLPHAKRIAHAMLQSIQSYEQAFGEIVTNPYERLTPEARQRLKSPSSHV